MINSFDFIILSETWKRITVDVDGFTMVTTGAVKTGKCGRNSGGLAFAAKDIYVCGVYIPPHNSNYFCSDMFDEFK